VGEEWIGILSVTCFAQMKYACIRLIPHPTGGLRRIDSRLCNLLRISSVIMEEEEELTLQVSLVELLLIYKVQS